MVKEIRQKNNMLRIKVRTYFYSFSDVRTKASTLNVLQTLFKLN
jgi:hypothetical protein